MSAQAQATEAHANQLPAAAFSQADIAVVFERTEEPVQLANLSIKEMEETEGAWVPFVFYYYGPPIACGVSWLATTGWRTTPGLWHNARMRLL